MTTTKKQHPIKAVKNFRRMAAEVVVTTSHAIQAHFDPANNPNLTGAASASGRYRYGQISYRPAIGQDRGGR